MTKEININLQSKISFKGEKKGTVNERSERDGWIIFFYGYFPSAFLMTF